LIPKFLELQIRSLIQASYSATEKFEEEEEERVSYVTPIPLLPYVVNENKVEKFRELVESINVAAQKEKEFSLSFKVGIMAEVQRACLILDNIADKVDVLMFNFDILQQTGFAISEVDVKDKFIARYCAQ
jgi:phosphoenolpyruvate-protein kinase (PTS system EI component)